MKVLFAINNDNVSNTIIKKYQKQYKEILSYKNVYYFNAILKELQKDKTYDRVVISEDLEPFANNDFDTIDKFIFEKLDKISDEATKQNGDDIEIILICSDRVNKSDSILVKFFSIGIYNAIIGNDRQIETVCSLINQPRTKKEAKIYYKIESNSVNYQLESENSVNETEVQNILAHYKRLGKNEDKYVDSFNTIVSQYTDEQLKVIIKCLPLNVRAVLEERSPKYQELATFAKDAKGKASQTGYGARKSGPKKEAITSKLLKDDSDKTKITKPIVIPTAMKGKNLKEIKEVQNNETASEDSIKKLASEVQDIEDDFAVETEKRELPEVVETVKRGRGRPKKIVDIEVPVIDEPKRGRGRPRKTDKEEQEIEQEIDSDNILEDIEMPDVKPNHNIDIPNVEIEEPLDLFGLDDEENEENKQENSVVADEENDADEVIDLFDLDDEESENVEIQNDSEEVQEDENEDFELPQVADETDDEDDESVEPVELFNMDEDETEEKNEAFEISNKNYKPDAFININNEIQETENNRKDVSENTLITKDVKVVCFVGTTKNGTSFLVNNVAAMLASMSIPTAILDMTKSRNAYYIYTKNEEKLRNIAVQSIKKLEQGLDNGIEVNRKLSIYTSLPDDDYTVNDVDTIISTLTKRHSVVLIDCDFDTDYRFFEKANEIYLVQSQDVLTIQPFTAFLRNLKAKNVLRQEKLKVVINKEQKVKGLTDKVLIGGMAYYNDPAMAFMTELFNKDKVMYCKIPFEMQNYAKYLSSMVDCSITLNGYTKQFMNALEQLTMMVYPLLNKTAYTPRGIKKKDKKNQDIFSSEVNDTLNRMKNNY